MEDLPRYVKDFDDILVCNASPIFKVNRKKVNRNEVKLYGKYGLKQNQVDFKCQKNQMLCSCFANILILQFVNK